MNSNAASKARFVFLALGIVALAIVATFSPWSVVLGSGGHVHTTSDWSNRHVVFSPPRTWLQSLRLAGNQRYLQQWIRRNAEQTGHLEDWRWRRAPANPNVLKGDWSSFIGNNGTLGAGVFPAKFSFDSTSASCTNDYVAFGNNLAGSTTHTPSQDLFTVVMEPALGTMFAITNGGSTMTLTASTTTGLGTFATDPVLANQAADLADAINFAGNGSVPGITAVATGTQVLVTSTGTGSSQDSIHVSTDTTSSFSYPFGFFQGGANGVADVVAFYNLYTGCSGFPNPFYAWAYNTGGTVKTSITLSGDGTQVAFVQTDNTTGGADLVILKWAHDSDIISPTNLSTPVVAGSYRGCSAPCQTTIAFNGGADDSNSSPFYDYAPGSDTLYVGDNNGIVHKFTGVFSGTPAEVTAGGWPVSLSTGNPLTSPVYDDGSGKVFVADGGPGGGFFYSVTATGVTAKSAYLTGGGSLGVVDSPILDPTNEKVYVTYGANGLADVVNQFSTGFADTDPGTPKTFGNPSQIYSGTFDNAYYSGGAGNMYVCGDGAGGPTLYQIAVTSTGVLGAVNTGPALTTGETTCSPVTEIYNPNASGGAKDWIFTSVQDLGQTTAPISCPSNSGCIMSFDVTLGTAISGATTTNARAAVAGGASGVVVDNSVPPGTGPGQLTGASQVYYTPLANGACTTGGNLGIGGCAIQASQQGLN